MKIRYWFSIAVLVFGVCILARAKRPDDPVLIKGTLHTHTNDDNKDHDTCVYADVKNSDGSSLLAHIANGDCGGDDATEYNDNSDHDIAFQIDSAGASKSSCKGFKVHMWQKTHGGAGHDTWKFDVRVTLEFSDHTNLTAEKTGVVLTSRSTSDSPSVDFSNPM